MNRKFYLCGNSKAHHLPEPSNEKVLSLIAELEKFTLVEQKSNLKRLLGAAVFNRS